jgi:hypothetical protein
MPDDHSQHKAISILNFYLALNNKKMKSPCHLNSIRRENSNLCVNKKKKMKTSHNPSSTCKQFLFSSCNVNKERDEDSTQSSEGNYMRRRGKGRVSQVLEFLESSTRKTTQKFKRCRDISQ